jgi:ferredoxin
VKENFGYVACTGCGRCVRSCPAGVNIKAIVSGIMEELG